MGLTVETSARPANLRSIIGDVYTCFRLSWADKCVLSSGGLSDALHWRSTMFLTLCEWAQQGAVWAVLAASPRLVLLAYRGLSELSPSGLLLVVDIDELGARPVFWWEVHVCQHLILAGQQHLGCLRPLRLHHCQLAPPASSLVNNASVRPLWGVAVPVPQHSA